jgi:hypothetical protein
MTKLGLALATVTLVVGVLLVGVLVSRGGAAGARARVVAATTAPGSDDGIVWGSPSD